MSGQRPTREQILATDPGGSNWVGANAGSGKTHVLTQRVARLLLHGAEPHKILCLTYTKAAASEMQSRLFRTLGEWAMASEDSLSRTLANLSGSDLPLRNDNRLAEARRLFARALETPGGLKIQTIHAFCESLLRRFPFEAGISPRFQVADDRQADEILAKIRADMALAAADATDDGFDRAASRLNEGSLNDLAKAVMTRRSDITLSDVEMRIGAHFGPDAEKTPVEIARHAMAALPDAW
ncbi:MAG: UvrD-helicase domain-containing protein, partial [Pseudomonadota bacterium]